MIDFLVSAPQVAIVLFLESIVMMAISAWFVNLMGKTRGSGRYVAAASAVFFAAVVPTSFYWAKYFIEG